MTDNKEVTTSWFYEQKGERKGGVEESELISLIESGSVTHGTLLWKEGFTEWKKIENTELSTHLNKTSPPPLSGEHVNNTVVWILAFAPIIGYLLEWFIAGAINGSERKAEQAMAEAKYFYITIILNIALSIFDEKRLAMAGYSTEKFKGMNWLVPVYLFQRAKYLNHSMAYFAVWLVSFAMIIIA